MYPAHPPTISTITGSPRRSCLRPPIAGTACLGLALLRGPQATHAADGIWNTDASGNWSDTTRWAGGTVADGTDAMARRIERVLTNDPGIGVARHVDAGYNEAVAFAEKKDIQIPMRDVNRE